MTWLFTTPSTIFIIALTVIGIYVALVALTRIAGLRSFSKMSGFDFAVTVAIGSVIAGTVMAPSPPLLQGAAALGLLFALQMSVAFIRVKFPAVTGLLDNKPRLIMVGDRIVHDQLRKAKITQSDLRAKLREANIIDYRQVEAVIAETTGDISVLHRSLNGPRLDPALLEGVIKAEEFVLPSHAS